MLSLQLTKEGKRNVTQVLLVVNPLDYWEKLFGATTVLNANGTYAHGVLPIPGKIVTSVAVPKGKWWLGLPATISCYRFRTKN